MGNASSMLTQYDIEEVQEHCSKLFKQQEMVSLYQRFCQLDRNAKGFISADEFMSVPEFAMNPLAQRLLKMVVGLSFKDFVSFLSAFSAKASLEQKVGRVELDKPNPSYHCLGWSLVRGIKIIIIVMVMGFFRKQGYDSDGNGKVSFDDILEVLHDLTGSFMSDEQRKDVLTQLLQETGYTRESYLLLDDFVKIFANSGMKMEIEVPVD